MRMDLRRLATTLIVVALAALALAACGGDARKDEYLDGLKGVKRHLDAATKASLESGSATTPKDRAAKLDEAHEQLEQAADAADALDPPDDAAGAHGDFADALQEYADLYEELASLEPGDPDEAELYGRAGTIAERLDSASRRLAKAGYRLPGTTQEKDE